MHDDTKQWTHAGMLQNPARPRAFLTLAFLILLASACGASAQQNGAPRRSACTQECDFHESTCQTNCGREGTEVCIERCGSERTACLGDCK